MLLEDYCPDEGVDTVVTLLIAVLCDEERDAALPDAAGILLHHVIAHNLDVTAIGVEQEVTHDVSLGVERYAVVSVGMGVEVFLQDDVVLTLGALIWCM